MRRTWGAWTAVVALVVGLVLVVPGGPPGASAAAGLPPGFVVTSSPSGQGPGDLTDVAYLPDGSAITTGKAGKVAWVPPTGAARQLAALPVTTVQDLGLVGVAVAPDYAVSRTVWLARTLAGGATNAWTMRLSRFTVAVDGDGEPVGLDGEVTLLEAPTTSDAHAMTGIEPAADGSLWVSVGDAADFRFADRNALRALDVDDVRGKVLHVDGATGRGLPGNPFWNGNPDAARSKVFATGFRSPFRLTVDPESGLPLLGDVGWQTTEEVDVVRPGASYGWPCFEGAVPTPGYRDFAECAGRGNTAPAHSYVHAPENGSSVTGGIVYTGATYPEQYRGAYFFGDYTSSKIWTMQFDAAGAVTRGPEPGGFGVGIGAPVSFVSGPNGDVVYADIADGTLKRISYAAGNRAPTAVATSTTDPALREVRFDAAGSYDLDGDPLTYRWDFGDGTGATGATAVHRYPATPAAFTARLTVSDAQGAEGTTQLRVAPANGAPALTLTAPPADRTFRVGDPVALSATAVDPEDGPLPVTWSTVAVHCRGDVCHDHPGAGQSGPEYGTVFEDHGDDTTQRITGTVTDAAGVSASRTYSARPTLVTLSLAGSVPATTSINGVDRGSAEVTVGARVSISAAGVGTDGVSTFRSWSDGGARAHDVTALATPLTLTATYRTAIDQRYDTDAAFRAAMGPVTGPETGDATLRWRDHAIGRAYWTPATGVTAVRGLIRDAFLALGGHAAVGVPTTDELTSFDGVGRWNAFGDKQIFWSPATGAHLIFGSIRATWNALGSERGVLGYPRTNELATPNGIGRYNHFAGSRGSVYWSPGTGAHAVWGSIAAKWESTGWEAGPLGFPVTSEGTTPDGVGRYNHFQFGSVYWTPGTGAQSVHGAIRTRWERLGWERSYLGYPTSSEFDVPGGKRTNFQGGYVTWDARTGAVVDRRY